MPTRRLLPRTAALVAALFALVAVTTVSPAVTTARFSDQAAASAAVTTMPIAEVTSVALGPNHGCALTVQERVSCWGVNTAGQATGVATSSYVDPTLVNSGAIAGVPIKQITTGATHSCALDAAGNAYCWGSNSQGQLGLGTSGAGAQLPTLVSGGLKFSRIDAGTDTTCGITLASTVYCWGDNQQGQVGRGNSTSPVTAPTAVVTTGVLSGLAISTLSVGVSTVCVTSTTNRLFCWGGARSNWLLANGTNAGSSSPVASTYGVLAGRDVTSVDVGTSHSCAIADGDVVCWGAARATASYVALHSGGPITTSPAIIAPGGIEGQPISGLAVGLDFTCVKIQSGSDIFCWGANEYGQVGDPSLRAAGDPRHLDLWDTVLQDETMTAVVAGGSRACALMASNRAACWGLSTSGILGSWVDPTVKNPGTPVAVDMTRGWTATGPFTKLATSMTNAGSTVLGAQSCAVSTAGVASCWGRPPASALAGQVGSFLTEAAAGAFWGKVITDMDSYGAQSCVLDQTGAAYCWGNSNSNGQLGDGTRTASTGAVKVATSVPFTSIEIGKDFACALGTDAKVYCWGSDAAGMMANGAIMADVLTPTAIGGLLTGKTITQVTAGQFHVCALDSTGQTYCWGNNAGGMIGNGVTTGTAVDPVDTGSFGALSGVQVKAIAAGSFHTCAVAVSRTVYCWGKNDGGQQATGTTSATLTATPAATPVLGDNIVANNSVTCAWSTSAISCWGPVAYGMRPPLGDGSTTGVGPSTVAPAWGSATLTDVSVSDYHACAIASGAVYCWGRSDELQLGNASVEPPHAYIPAYLVAPVA